MIYSYCSSVCVPHPIPGRSIPTQATMVLPWASDCRIPTTDSHQWIPDRYVVVVQQDEYTSYIQHTNDPPLYWGLQPDKSTYHSYVCILHWQSLPMFTMSSLIPCHHIMHHADCISLGIPTILYHPIDNHGLLRDSTIHPQWDTALESSYQILPGIPWLCGIS